MKTTPLNIWHHQQGANLAEFGGYEMPLWYSSAKNEHLSVLTGVGIFDTSHMAVVVVEGPQARALLQHCFSRDLEQCMGPLHHPLQPGKCVYGVFLNEKGHVIDDAIVDQLDDNRYLVVVNAGMGDPVASHLNGQARGIEVTIRDLTDQVGKVDIQGPKSARVLAKILKNPDAVFDGMAYFTFKGTFMDLKGESAPVLLKNGLPILLSRTGYTGEFGFEIFSDAAHIVEIWNEILEAGREAGITPCGLAARDSLRAGAVLPLSHQDIGHWPFLRNPWIFALPYTEGQSGFTKEFIGDSALLSARDADYTYPFVGKDLRKVTTTGETEVVDEQGRGIGTVLTCVSDMGIGRVGERLYSIASPDKPEGFVPRGLSCGFVKVHPRLPAGTSLELRDGRRAITVTVTHDIRPDRTARVPIRKML